MKREISMLFRRSKKIMNRAISLLMVITMLKMQFYCQRFRRFRYLQQQDWI